MGNQLQTLTSESDVSQVIEQPEPGQRTWFGSPVPDPPSEAATQTGAGTAPAAPDAEEWPSAFRALYVNGPGGMTRYLLPEGHVHVGRGATATIPLDDPRVSREHAVLRVGKGVTLVDVGSRNGTFVRSRRLPPGEPWPLARGEPFFVGSSALVVDAAPLAAQRRQPLASFDEVRGRLGVSLAPAGAPPEAAPHVLVLRVRPAQRLTPEALEGVLAAVAWSPRGWTWWDGTRQLLAGIEVRSWRDAARLERAAAEQLAGWGAQADIDAILLSSQDVDSAGDGLRGLLCGESPVQLKRGKIVFRDPAMQSLRRTITRVAGATVNVLNVLILGETGVGKDVVACMVHELSARSDKPFIGINCSSLPDQLLESELFGYEPGAFTGAVKAKPGLIESADGGTVFLDEVGDLSPSLQAKLLRVIESGEVMRVGAVRPRSVDVRYTAATNHDLARAVESGRFRRDLFYRLNCVTLTVPPLRERPSEIEPLADLFLASACTRFGLPGRRLSTAAAAALQGYPWPGNVRELRNVVERAVLLASGPLIEAAHLGLPPIHEQPSPPEPPTPPADAAADAGKPGDAPSERDRIAQALVVCGGNQRRAAELLGVSRRTLVRQLSRLGLPRPRGARS